MAVLANKTVLQEAGWPVQGSEIWTKRILLVVAGIAVLMLAAKIKVPVPPSPVPITMQTFAVLTIGAAYGPRLGLVTILGYVLVGALGLDVFATSSAVKNGLPYMMSYSGGFIFGFVLATIALGYAATKGWDRNVLSMALALLIGNVLIYVPGVLWMRHVIEVNGAFDAAKYASVWAQTFDWGVTKYLIGDAMKLALAALLVPAVWKMVGSART